MQVHHLGQLRQIGEGPSNNALPGMHGLAAIRDLAVGRVGINKHGVVRWVARMTSSGSSNRSGGTSNGQEQRPHAGRTTRTQAALTEGTDSDVASLLSLIFFGHCS